MSRTARRSGPSGGRSKAATRPRPSRPRSPVSWRPARSPTEHGDLSSARLYRATADHFQRSIKAWTVTTTGPYGTGRYFIRLSKNGDPNSADTINLGNGSVTVDQRTVVDAGFLELTRLGELPANDPDVADSLAVVDSTISATTPNGVGYYRYGTSTAGSEDGYGDCYEPDATDLLAHRIALAHNGSWLWSPVAGARRRAGRAGPVGRRPDRRRPSARTMDAMSSGVGLVPEQAWEDPDLAASAYGSDPTTASIGFVDGQAAGSASPLTWAQAQEVRLTQSLAPGHRSSGRPSCAARYAGGSVAAADVAITAPGPGADDRHRDRRSDRYGDAGGQGRRRRDADRHWRRHGASDRPRATQPGPGPRLCLPRWEPTS